MVKVRPTVARTLDDRKSSQAAALVAMIALMVGCSSPSTSSIRGAALNASVKDQLREAGVEVTAMNCPDSLLDRVGETTRCTFHTPGGRPIDVVAKVTSTEGKTATLDLTTEARTIPKDTLAEMVVDRIRQNRGRAPEWAACTRDLVPQVNVTSDCSVVLGGQTFALTATVTSTGGGLVEFRYTVA